MRQGVTISIIVVILMATLGSLAGCSSQLLTVEAQPSKPHSTTAKSSSHYKLDDDVIITTAREKNMKNKVAKIVKVMHTKYYAVSFPGNDDYKWIVQDEIQNRPEVLKKGDQIVLTAYHLNGVVAKVKDIHEGFIYEVAYKLNNDEVTYRWMTSNEIKTKN